MPLESEPRTGVVPDALDGERLDRALAQVFAISRGEARRQLADGRVLLDRKPCRVAGRRVRAGATVALIAAPLEWTAAEPRVVLEEPGLVVLDKPPGVAVQPGQDPRLPDLVHWWRTREPRETLRVVHRLDVPASGLVVLARQRGAAGKLSAAFRDRTVERMYRVRTSAPVPGLTADAPLVVDQPLAKRDGMAVPTDEPDARPALSTCRLLARDASHDELEVTLDSGRFHQIRAHLAHLGAPVLGDRRYGGAPADRLYLHAARLTIPTSRGTQRLSSPAPWDAPA